MRTKSPPSKDLYAVARRTLEKAIRDSDKFEQALALAIRHCEKARAYDWSEAEIWQLAREAKGSWGSANAAARKLATHFETLDPLTGHMRLTQAWEELGKSGIKGTPPLHSSIFIALLRALANQVPRAKSKHRGYTFGPLRIGESSRRMPSREVALTVALAHIFDRVVAHNSSRLDLSLNNGEAIKSGRAWEAAADFASVAIDRVVDANAAKKYLRDHRGHLSLRLWPKPRKRPVLLREANK